MYATTFTAPLLQTNHFVSEFIQQGFSKPITIDSIPQRAWIPTDTLLSYDAVNVFVQTIKNWKSGDTSQEAFNTVLANISFDGVSGEIILQGNRNSGHSSDRDQGYVYITCNDYTHTNHLLAQYSTINDGTSSAQNLPLDDADSINSCNSVR